MAHPFDADQWEEVKSSNLKAVGTKDDWLIVQFRKNQAAYRYKGYDYLFNDLVTAVSAGKLLRQEVLSNTSGERLLNNEWPVD